MELAARTRAMRVPHSFDWPDWARGCQPPPEYHTFCTLARAHAHADSVRCVGSSATNLSDYIHECIAQISKKVQADVRAEAAKSTTNRPKANKPKPKATTKKKKKKAAKAAKAAAAKSGAKVSAVIFSLSAR